MTNRQRISEIVKIFANNTIRSVTALSLAYEFADNKALADRLFKSAHRHNDEAVEAALELYKRYGIELVYGLRSMNNGEKDEV